MAVKHTMSVTRKDAPTTESARVRPRRIGSSEEALAEHHRRALRLLEDVLAQVREEHRTVSALVERLSAGLGRRRRSDPGDGVIAPETDYAQAIAEIQRIGRLAFPRQSVVAVVSKGDDRLLDLGTARGWHFPQAEGGVYAGHHPADSASAIAHLDRLRTRGAHFLLIPCTAYWWLEHYGEFREHLDERYCRTWQSAACQIYQLRPMGEVAVVTEGAPGRAECTAPAEGPRVIPAGRRPRTDWRAEAVRSRSRGCRLEQVVTDGVSISGRIVTRAASGDQRALPPTVVIENALGERIASPAVAESETSGPRRASRAWCFTARIGIKAIIRSNSFTVFVVNGKTRTRVGGPVRFGILFDVKAGQQGLSGWALDPDDPSARVSVRVHDPADRDRNAAETRATLFRQDLKAHSGRDGFFGFEVPWSGGLSADVEFSSPLHAKGSRVTLDGSTKSERAV